MSRQEQAMAIRKAANDLLAREGYGTDFAPRSAV
jgi:hypothetical protein